MSRPRPVAWTAGKARHGRHTALVWNGAMGLPPGWAVWLPGSEFPVSEGDARTMDAAREQAGDELRRLARQRTRIRITRCHDPDLRGRTYGGHTASTIGRRLFGRTAYAIPSADPNNRGQGMIARDDRHGTHVLADYVEYSE